MSRNKPHVIETKSRDYLISKINSIYEMNSFMMNH